MRPSQALLLAVIALFSFWGPGTANAAWLSPERSLAHDTHTTNAPVILVQRWRGGGAIRNNQWQQQQRLQRQQQLRQRQLQQQREQARRYQQQQRQKALQQEQARKAAQREQARRVAERERIDRARRSLRRAPSIALRAGTISGRTPTLLDRSSPSNSDRLDGPRHPQRYFGRKLSPSGIEARFAGDNLTRSSRISGSFNSITNATVVIGKVRTLQSVQTGKSYSRLRDTTLRKNEMTLLSRLPNRGTPQSNWRQNYSELRKEIRKGIPIRDGSVNPNIGSTLRTSNTGFLMMERFILKSRGWVYNSSTQHWHPPN
ncbi:hypothetical protein SAMN06297251_101460 [Fulvimarina manganoxydans]|uniref:Uncharacterized protein n=1 Tax=Fulvimarina manganoxydans TaxID=937218 RepID=A0A1W1YLQ0_9HYPH|nr:hypothetical protein SAMN06297251_101460 [Fulvimarina manganoxydans]